MLGRLLSNPKSGGYSRTLFVQLDLHFVSCIDSAATVSISRLSADGSAKTVGVCGMQHLLLPMPLLTV